jgi:hypothetical protein
MSTKRMCDICGKEIGLRWFVLERKHKEMDYGMVMSEGTYEVCSKECLIKLVDKLKEFTKLETMYDSPTDYPQNG